MDIKERVSLKKYNTFGFDIQARYFCEASDIQCLRDCLNFADKENCSVVLLGGGSNVLLTKDIEYLVLKVNLTGYEIVSENDEFVWFKAGAGEIWHDLVLSTLEKGWGGIENLSLIPGLVGAAPMQNIGAYGVELKDVFYSLEALNRKSMEIEIFDKDSCKFGYRESVFKKELKDQYIITSVTLKLSKNPVVNVSYGAISDVLKSKRIKTPTIRDVSNTVIQIRQSKLPDPKVIGNAGSFFKNPVISKSQFEQIRAGYPKVPSYAQSDGQVKIPAGWLIEQCGWKGRRMGEIGVHDKQALVLVNHGNGRGEDVYQLSEDILQSVKKEFGIELHREVNVF